MGIIYCSTGVPYGDSRGYFCASLYRGLWRRHFDLYEQRAIGVDSSTEIDCWECQRTQGNATEGLGLVEAYDAESPNLFDVVAGHEPAETICDLVEEQTEMDVVPSDVDMPNAKRDLIIADYEGEDSLTFLHDAVRVLEEEYDVVLIRLPAVLRATHRRGALRRTEHAGARVDRVHVRTRGRTPP